MILTIDEIIDILKTTPDFFVHIYHKLSDSDLMEIKKHKYSNINIPIEKLNMDLINKLNFVNMKTYDNAINFLVLGCNDSGHRYNNYLSQLKFLEDRHIEIKHDLILKAIEYAFYRISDHDTIIKEKYTDELITMIKKFKEIPPYLNNSGFYYHLIQNNKIFDVLEFIKKIYDSSMFADVAIKDTDYEKRFHIYCKLLCRTEIFDVLSRKKVDQSKVLDLTIKHKLYDSQKILSLLDPSDKIKISNIINTGKMLKLKNQDTHQLIVSEYAKSSDLSIINNIELS